MAFPLGRLSSFPVEAFTMALNSAGVRPKPVTSIWSPSAALKTPLL